MKRLIFHMDDEENVEGTDANGIPQTTDSFGVLFQSPKKRIRTFAFSIPQQPSILSQIGIVNHLNPLQTDHDDKESSNGGNKGQCDESDDDDDSLMDSDLEGGVNAKPTRRQGMSAKMAAFVPHLHALQKCIIQHESQSGVNLACSHCQTGEKAVYRPSTVFTFEMLEDFHRHSLNSKITAYDYFGALREHTDAAFPIGVDDRYCELMTVMRVWRTLALLRRSGVDLGIGVYLPYRREGSIALRCPACPEVGFNVDEETLQKALAVETHKYTFYIMVDGNFRLQQKKKTMDPDDFALNGGRSYFVEDSAFREYLDKVGDLQKNNSTCAKLKAVRQQEMIKFRNMVISGVIAVQCARHGFYLPQGIVDLTKGESYARADYALANALGHEAKRLRWIMLSYDIWCQYSKNLKARMCAVETSGFWPWMTRVVDKIRGAIPKMHIHGHNEKCQLYCSFLYTPYSGMTCGEGIESAWAEQNHAAGSTRELSGGHRHDTLDDFNNYWNWSKLQRLTSYLLQRFKKYSNEYRNMEVLIGNLERRILPTTVQEWKKMESDPPLGKNQKPRMDKLYQAAKAKLPTQKSQASKLVAAEPDDVESESESDSPAAQTLVSIDTKLVHFIEEGIRIEKQQKYIQCQKKTMDPEELEDARGILRKSIKQWRSLQCEICPQIISSTDFETVDNNRPERQKLLLPSFFGIDRAKSLGLEMLIQVEYHLRLGQAYDAIDSLRIAVYHFNAAKGQKKQHIRGVRYVTRANKILNDLAEDKYTCAQVYQLAYKALVSIGLPHDSELRPLHRSELWGRDMTTVYGPGGSAPEPWWWMVGKPPSLSEDAWHTELDRVRWFRMRAALNRMHEELEILHEEFKRTIRSFSKYELIWRNLGDSTLSRGPGFSPYAYRQATMYGRFSSVARADFEKAIEHAPSRVKLT
ncbi:hypothetical protein NP233_g436 [Leucocoprinus birnbaumii]|uniref:CxC2-like cysteine cluster KDZ transposase-associated domain-containing protein n=1 Tax=Leucocoprinus birnbaumii TaxID=56174 RepID=A0AAD5W3S6_9AGAR|nr:hypothetical protein NP233_g436 [Leucocoprinus birnbaumii]